MKQLTPLRTDSGLLIGSRYTFESDPHRSTWYDMSHDEERLQLALIRKQDKPSTMRRLLPVVLAVAVIALLAAVNA